MVRPSAARRSKAPARHSAQPMPPLPAPIAGKRVERKARLDVATATDDELRADILRRLECLDAIRTQSDGPPAG
jgi:hypothetical protein